MGGVVGLQPQRRAGPARRLLVDAGDRRHDVAGRGPVGGEAGVERAFGRRRHEHLVAPLLQRAGGEVGTAARRRTDADEQLVRGHLIRLCRLRRPAGQRQPSGRRQNDRVASLSRCSVPSAKRSQPRSPAPDVTTSTSPGTAKR